MGSSTSKTAARSNDSPPPRTWLDCVGSSAFCTLFASLAGAVWGLGLARALAEYYPFSLTFDLVPSLAFALIFALIAAAGCWWLTRKTGAQHIAPAFFPLFLVGGYVLWTEFAPHVGWTLLAGSLVLFGLLALRSVWPQSSPKSDHMFFWLVAVCLGLFILAVYLLTLGPTVGQADTFEFQVVAPTLGVAHPTGYPLYILSGKLFSLLPLGSIAWRVNLTSAVFGTLAAMCVFLIVVRLTGRTIGAFLAALAFAFSQVFWSQAVIAEVYALHNLIVGMILMLLVEVASRGLPNSDSQFDAAWAGGHDGLPWSRAQDRHLVYALALLFGLGLANHLTTVLLFPAAALALFFLRPRLTWREWATAVVVFLVPLGFYLYIFFRWPALNEGVWMSLGEFWRYVTGQQFGGALRLDAWLTDPSRHEIIARLLREPFGWPGVTLAVWGLIWLGIKSWRVALVTSAACVPFIWYALGYYVPDVSVFVLPAHLILAVWIGVGMAAILNIGLALAHRLGRSSGLAGLDRDARWSIRSAAYAVLITALSVLPLSILWANFHQIDQSNAWDDYRWGERVLDLSVSPGAAVLADSARIAPLYYLQRIEGRRPDLDLLVLANEAMYRAELEERLAIGQSVYLARYLPGLEGRYHLDSLGPLTEVRTEPLAGSPGYDRSMGIRFALLDAPEQYLELLGLTGPTMGPEGGTGLTLYWRATESVDEAYHVRMRLVDDEGKVWWQDAGRHAANNYYPTPAWRPGEPVADYHEIPPLEVESNAVPDRLSLQVGWFLPFAEDGLVAETGEKWYPVSLLSPVPVRIDPAPNRSLRIQFADLDGKLPGSDTTLALVGADLPETVSAGAEMELTLFFSSPEGAGEHLSTLGLPQNLALTWVDGQGNAVPATVVENWGPSRLMLQAPDLPAEYELRLGLVGGQGQETAARCGWLARSTTACTLGKLRVTEPTALALANFGGQLLLRDAAFDNHEPSDDSVNALVPGQSVPVTLDWQALESMHDDYTVSVQLVGPDGRLYGQTDSWPVHGTLPTSQWQPRQRVTDAYQVVLSSDAPPGEYRVGVVVYLLKTQQRLPVLDNSGQAKGDVVWIDDFEVLSNSP